jgi:two-component system, NtrC family, response regulator AtoC
MMVSTMCQKQPDGSTLTLVQQDDRGGPDLELVVVSGGQVRLHRLPRESRAIVGRSAAADVVVGDPSVSRAHAELVVGPEGATIRDLESRNGTSINGQRLEPGSAAPLPSGAHVMLGEVSCFLERRRPQAAAGPAAPSADGVYVGAWLQESWAALALIASGDIPILLLGETGVGKDVVAGLVHRHSPRGGGPFVAVNCAALPQQLVESELFGHQKGAFSGATNAKPGLVEQASGGTLMLDEVGDLPLEAQAKLLRLLDTGELRRLGSVREIRCDVRIVTATNRDIEDLVARGTFRADLFYRINAYTLTIPPLRERPDDVAGIARLVAAASGASLAAETLTLLTSYGWPGNVRELRNVIERAALLAAGLAIEPAHLPPALRGARGPVGSPSAAGGPRGAVPDERRAICEALETCAGNQTHAARLLGISRRTLVSRLDQYGLPRPRKGR